ALAQSAPMASKAQVNPILRTFIFVTSYGSLRNRLWSADCGCTLKQDAASWEFSYALQRATVWAERIVRDAENVVRGEFFRQLRAGARVRVKQVGFQNGQWLVAAFC